MDYSVFYYGSYKLCYVGDFRVSLVISQKADSVSSFLTSYPRSLDEAKRNQGLALYSEVTIP